MSPKFSAKCGELAAYVAVAAIAGLVIILIAALTPLSWQVVGSLTIVALVLVLVIIHRQRLARLVPARASKQTEPPAPVALPTAQSANDDVSRTQPIPVVSKAATVNTSEWTNEKLSPLKRQVVTNSQGQQVLFASDVETQKVGSLGRRTKQYRRVVHSILLDNSDLVDPEAAIRSNYIPTSDESKVYYFHRLSWWKFGLQKIGLVAWMLFCVIAAIVTAFKSWLSLDYGLLLAVGGIFSGLIGFWLIWIDWQHRYLILTDRRLILAYHPPYGLEGKMQPIDLSTILNNNAVDSLFSNWFLTNSPNKYGSIKADTAAQQDAWLNDIKFVRRHEALHRLVDELKRSGTTEESRQLEVSEQTNTLLQSILGRLPSSHNSES